MLEKPCALARGVVTGIRTINKPDGNTEYELNWEGAKKIFTVKNEAYEVLSLHMKKDAGGQLKPDEEARLVVNQLPAEAAQPASDTSEK